MSGRHWTTPASDVDLARYPDAVDEWWEETEGVTRCETAGRHVFYRVGDIEVGFGPLYDEIYRLHDDGDGVPWDDINEVDTAISVADRLRHERGW